MVAFRKQLCVTLLPLLLLAEPSFARSQVCEDLLLQLSANRQDMSREGEDGRQYAGAIARQNLLVRRLRNELRQSGCSSGSIVVYGGRNRAACDDTGYRLEQAEAELDSLMARRDAVTHGSRVEAERRALLASLADHGCDREEPVQASVSPQQAVPSMQPQTEGSIIRFSSPDPALPQGRLRTMCVRTCDGAFFPVSSQASPMDFANQAQQCASMCPGAETELFYHSLTEQESADMVSALTGRAYRDLPNAFAYRSNTRGSNPQCGCKMPSYGADAPSSGGSIVDIGKEKAAENPEKKPAPDGVAAQKEQLPAPPEREYRPQDGGVRMVGPQFLPAGEGHLDLANPALKGAQPLQ